MTNNQIVPNPLFSGSFIYNGQEYANYASALAAQGSDCRFQTHVQNAPQVKQVTVECKGFQSPSGQFYAVVSSGDTDIRVDCHNAATLRGWIKNGIGFASFTEAASDLRNHRTAGGWGA